jgi:hypothetical protein
MKTHINPSVARITLIVMAASSLLAMFSINQINYIVHGDLYNYNLSFSYAWAIPYWVLSGIIFGLCWVNIIITAVTAVYVFKKRNIASTTQEEYSESQLKEVEQREITEFTPPQDNTQEVTAEMQEEIDPQ